MSSYARSFAVFALIAGVCLTPAEASHKKHHPWGAGHYASKTAVVSHHATPGTQVASTSLTSTDKSSITEKPLYGDLDIRKADAGTEIAQQALVYKGSRYKFGGTSDKGMDCSGLVSRIYADLKMHRVPRVTAALYKSGRPVDVAQLRPGDLVFFKNTYKHGISHVGVYAGDNKFIHAANKRHGVIVTSMADPYYQLHFAGARRLY
jgi:cell wall-associated NlpC family hydrolase